MPFKNERRRFNHVYSFSCSLNNVQWSLVIHPSCGPAVTASATALGLPIRTEFSQNSPDWLQFLIMPNTTASLDGLIVRALTLEIPVVAASWLEAWEERKVWKNERPQPEDHLVWFQDMYGEILDQDAWKRATPHRHGALSKYELVWKKGKSGTAAIPFLGDVSYVASSTAGAAIIIPSWTPKSKAKGSAKKPAPWEEPKDDHTPLVILKSFDDKDEVVAEGYAFTTIERLLWHIFDPEMVPLFEEEVFVGTAAGTAPTAADNQQQQRPVEDDTESVETGRSLQPLHATEMDHFVAATPSGSPQKRQKGEHTAAAGGAGGAGTSRATRARVSLGGNEQVNKDIKSTKEQVYGVAVTPSRAAAEVGTVPDSVEPSSVAAPSPSVRQTRGTSNASKRKQPPVGAVSDHDGKDIADGRAHPAEVTPISKRRRTKEDAIGNAQPSPVAAQPLPSAKGGETSAKKRGRQVVQAVQDDEEAVQAGEQAAAAGASAPGFSKQRHSISHASPLDGWKSVARKQPRLDQSPSPSPDKAGQRKRRRGGAAAIKQEPAGAAVKQEGAPQVKNEAAAVGDDSSAPDAATTAAAAAAVPLAVDTSAVIMDASLVVLPSTLNGNSALEPSRTVPGATTRGGFKAFRRKGNVTGGSSSRLPQISFDPEPYREDNGINNDDFLKEEAARAKALKTADALFNANINVKRDKASFEAGNARLLAMLPPETRRKLEAAKIAAAAKPTAEDNEGKPAAAAKKGPAKKRGGK